MGSLTNPYFKHNTATTEQNLFEAMQIESIQILGSTFYYLPRKVQRFDLVLGEDILSKFDVAVPIEAYLSDVSGFTGQREFFSKFGLQVSNSYEVIMSMKRWLKETSAVTGKLNDLRPSEGDLLYDPMTKMLYEIKFVDHDYTFYQLGKNYLYHLSCEAFQYNSEVLTTGIAGIDSIDLNNSFDILGMQMITEDGNPFSLDQDSCFYIILEGTDIEDPNEVKDFGRSAEFFNEGQTINFNVKNPFGDGV